MDYSPPPIIQEHVIHVADQKDKNLVISVDRAVYDGATKVAEIKMERAFQKSHAIEFYRGDVITLVYKDEKPDLTQCPDVSVPVDDIRREIDYAENTVTLRISNISKSLADSIERNLCLFIDVDTVKRVADPNYMSAEERAEKKKKGGFFNL